MILEENIQTSKLRRLNCLNDKWNKDKTLA